MVKPTWLCHGQPSYPCCRSVTAGMGSWGIGTHQGKTTVFSSYWKKRHVEMVIYLKINNKKPPKNHKKNLQNMYNILGVGKDSRECSLSLYRRHPWRPQWGVIPYFHGSTEKQNGSWGCQAKRTAEKSRMIEKY